MPRPPLSARNDANAIEQYNALHDGIPGWMLASVTAWATGFFFSQGFGAAQAVQKAEQHLRVQLVWNGGSELARATSAAHGLLGMLSNGRQGLDLLDYCLGECNPFLKKAETLQQILDASASAWTVGKDQDGKLCLEERVDPTVETAAKEEMSLPGKASTYLRDAWHGVYGRDQNPSAAYRDAIRAVEAAARPIVTPKDDIATLGKMIKAISDAPQKWTTEIGDVETIRKMMQTVWQAQHDRHGTDDETKPVNVSQPEAEAAVQMAVTLVHLFRSGAIRVAPTP